MAKSKKSSPGKGAKVKGLVKKPDGKKKAMIPLPEIDDQMKAFLPIFPDADKDGEKEKLLISSASDTLHRLFPDRPVYKELSPAEVIQVYPARREAVSTRTGKIARIKTISRISHYLCDFDAIRELMNPYNMGHYTPSSVVKIFTYLASYVILSSAQSLTNYCVIFKDLIIDWEAMSPSDSAEVFSHVKRRTRTLLIKEDPRSAPPPDVEAIKSIPPMKRAPLLLWCFSGLRHIHFRSLKASDLKVCEYDNGRGGVDKEIFINCPRDKNINFVNRSFSVRCACTKDDGKELCLIHHVVMHKQIMKLASQKDQSAQLVVNSEELITSIGCVGHSPHLGLAQSISFCAEQYRIRTGGYPTISRSRFQVMMGWSQFGSNMVEYYTRSSPYWDGRCSRLPAGPVIHNVTFGASTIKLLGVTGEISIIDTPYYNNNLNASKSVEASAAIDGILNTKDRDLVTDVRGQKNIYISIEVARLLAKYARKGIAAERAKQSDTERFAEEVEEAVASGADDVSVLVEGEDFEDEFGI